MAFALHNGDTAKPRAYSRRRHSVATGTKRGKSLRFCEHPVPTSGLEYSAARDPDKVLFRGIPYPCAMSHGPQIREVDVARDTDQVPSLFQPHEHISGTPRSAARVARRRERESSAPIQHPKDSLRIHIRICHSDNTMLQKARPRKTAPVKLTDPQSSLTAASSRF